MAIVPEVHAKYRLSKAGVLKLDTGSNIMATSKVSLWITLGYRVQLEYI